MNNNFYNINIYLLETNQRFVDPIYHTPYSSFIDDKDGSKKLFTSQKISTSYGCTIYRYDNTDKFDPYSRKDKISKEKIINEKYGNCVITNITTNKNFDLTSKIKSFIEAFNATYDTVYYQVKTMQLTSQLYLQIGYISIDPVPALLVLEYNEERISISPSNYKVDYKQYKDTYIDIYERKDNVTLLPIPLLVDNNLRPLYQNEYMQNIIGDDLSTITELFTSKIVYYMKKLITCIEQNKIDNKYFSNAGSILYFDKLAILNLILDDLKIYNKLQPVTKKFLKEHPKTLNYLSKIINESEE